MAEKYPLGELGSNVELDQEVFRLLRLVVAGLVARGVSKRQIIASLGRVLRHDGRRL